MSNTLSKTYKKVSQRLDKAVTDQQGGDWSSDKQENDNLWRIEARKHLDGLKKKGDPNVGKLFLELSAAAEAQQLIGFGYFVWAMAEFGDPKRALTGACEAASLMPPPEDVGLIGRMVDRSRGRMKAMGPALSRFWTNLITPR